MAREMFAAFGFLTRVPVPGAASADVGGLRRAAAWFPLAGAAVGLCSGVAAALGGWLIGPVFGGAAAALAAVLATGGLHQDGLMDAADGVLSGGERGRMLDVMRDSRVGAMGALAGTLALLMRAALMAELLARLAAPFAVCGAMAAGACGRWSMTLALARHRAARPGSGLGGALVGAVGRREVALATLLAGAAAVVPAAVGGVLAPSAQVLPRAGGQPLLAGGGAMLLAWAVGRAAARWLDGRLGGLTGDCCGAIQEVSELAALAGFVAVMMR